MSERKCGGGRELRFAYLISQPDVPELLLGTITSAEPITFVVGDVHERPGRAPWVVADVRPSPKPGYEALIVFDSGSAVPAFTDALRPSRGEHVVDDCALRVV